MTDPAWCYRASAAAFLVLASGGQAFAADCAFERQGEGRVAAVLDGRSLRLEDGREIRLAGIERDGTDTARGRAALSAIAGGRDVTLHGDDDRRIAMAARSPFCSRPARQQSVQSELLRRGEALILRRYRRQKLRSSAGRRRRRRAGCQIGHLGRNRGHKKRGKFGRHSGGDWAVYGGRGQGSVRSAGGGDYLPELRTKLDTGLCCDYFKAHHTGVRERRPWT